MERIPVSLGDRSYTIEVEAGSLTRAGAFVHDATGIRPGKAAVVTTDTVAKLYLDTVKRSLADEGYDVCEIVVPDGERYKTLDTYTTIMTRLIESRFERRSVVVPLGGGVIGDTAGFAAATLLRGVPFVQIPTTIVSQVDSSIGGKVAVNHQLGKNLIGNFYQPRGVLIDTRVLKTLDPREVQSGTGEVIKHAVIRDRSFFDFLEDHLDDIMSLTASDSLIEKFIASNCRIKSSVVSEDEREGGIRAILNYGHTIGHALEAVTDYRRFTHGEAVMLGMIAAGHISVGRGLWDQSDHERQNALVARAGIVRGIDGINAGEVLEAMKHDKKVIDGNVRFILPDGIGSANIFDDVTESEAKNAISYLINN